MAQMQVFVSHSSQDSATANALVTALRQAGADVWFDEHNFSTGQILDEITRQLRTRPVFIVLLSQAAFGSEWVRRECKWAYSLYSRDPGRIILPVVVAPVDPSAFDEMLFLEDFKRIEGAPGQPHSDDEIISQALRLLALPPGERTTAESDVPAKASYEDLLMRGKALAASDQKEEAVALLRQATESDPNQVEAWSILCRTLVTMGDRGDEALVACERALALHPNDALLWLYKAKVLNDLERVEEAEAASVRATEINPRVMMDFLKEELAQIDRLTAEVAAEVAANRAASRDADGDALAPLDIDALKMFLKMAALGPESFGAASDVEYLDDLLELSDDDDLTGMLWAAKCLAYLKFGQKDEGREAAKRAQEYGVDVAATIRAVQLLLTEDKQA